MPSATAPSSPQRPSNPKAPRLRRVGRPPGPAADPGQRRAELLDAAARAIRRVGPDASMDEIAAEAGLSKPILYLNFGDKAGLGQALAERFASHLVEEVMATFETTTEPREMVRGAIDKFIGFVESEPNLYLFFARGVVGSKQPVAEQRLVLELGMRLAQVLRTQLGAATSDARPAELWAFSVLGSVFVGAEWWLLRKSMSRKELVDYLTGLTWNGLSGPGS